jgi:hypothetical protein
MKTKIMAVLAAGMASFGWQADAQTNSPAAPTNPPSEFRVVNYKVYDVNNSPEWKTIEIPQSAAIKNLTQPWLRWPRLTFDGVIRPQTVVFQIPAIYNFSKPICAVVENYPYSPRDFISGNMQDGFEGVSINRRPALIPSLLVPKTMNLRVFQTSKSTTNWDAYGHALIRPAQPLFDYGLPGTTIPARPFPSMLPSHSQPR